MTDYQIQASSRRCSVTGRELSPGEPYYSALMDESGTLVRKDFSEQAWQGPPLAAFSFWKSRVPTRQTSRRPPMDDELLVECFHRLEGEPEPNKLSFRYVLALLLIRRKRMRLEDTQKDGRHEVLVVRCLRTGARVQVIDPGLSDDELDAVQDDVFRVLGWE